MSGLKGNSAFRACGKCWCVSDCGLTVCAPPRRPCCGGAGLLLFAPPRSRQGSQYAQSLSQAQVIAGQNT